jgi:hypothetical protein
VTALTLAVAYVLGVVAVARLVRLVVADAWPPVAALRERWKVATAPKGEDGKAVLVDGSVAEGPGTPLFTCPWCFAAYPTAVAVAAAHVAGVWAPDLTTLGGWWWTLVVWASASYAAPMIVTRDEPAPVYED